MDWLRMHCYFFFFSSRRRHTRLQGDWSSDVCSSDLACLFFAGTWFRNLIVALASGRLKGGQLGWELLVWSPLQSLTTAVAGVGAALLVGRLPSSPPRAPCTRVTRTSPTARRAWARGPRGGGRASRRGRS